MAPPPPATAMDKLGIMANMARMLVTAITHLLTAPIRSGPRPATLYKDVMYAVTRTQLRLMSIVQERHLEASTEDTYLDLAKKEGFQPDSINLKDGSKAYWMGAKSAQKVIVYFHGGGYVLSCSPGHAKWLFEITQALAKNYSVSSILLGYTTAPEAHYPTQLNQAADLLHHLLEVEGRKPSDIIIAGDSAGGNLTLALLSHILHPHPAVSTKINISEPFCGAILISPWAKFEVDDATFRKYEQTDMLDKGIAERWGGAFLGGAKLDNYNQPIIADKAWFKDLESIVREILVWGGGGEVLIDSIREMAEKLKEVHKKTEVIVQPIVGHEDFIIEKLIGITEKAQGTVVIEEWISSKL